MEEFKREKIFAHKPLVKLRSNFASVGVWILFKISSDIVQQILPIVTFTVLGKEVLPLSRSICAQATTKNSLEIR